jgi:hypothetical protein
LREALHASLKDGGFEAIGGFAPDEMYAVGWDGVIAEWNGRKWRPGKTPTELILTGLACAGDVVYACGQEGTLVRGRHGDWEPVETGLSEDLWDVRWFGGALYAATLTHVYVLGKSALTEVKFGRARPRTCGRLSDAEGVLWSIGDRDVFSTDGKRWRRVD